MANVSFAWDSSLELGIPEIDEQHKKLFEIGERLNFLIENHTASDNQIELVKIMVELKEFAGYHFYTEEKLMDECKYQKRAEHKKQHKELIDNLFSNKNVQKNENSKIALIAMRSMILDIIWTHVSVADKEFGRAYRRYIKLFKHMEDKRKEARKSLDEKFGTIIKEFDMTLFYLYKDQTIRGHSVLTTRESRSGYSKLNTLEKNTFMHDVTRAIEAIAKTFTPDDIQLIYATDVDNQVAVHLIPKFKDTDAYGKVWCNSTDFEILPEEKYEALALEISRNM